MHKYFGLFAISVLLAACGGGSDSEPPIKPLSDVPPSFFYTGAASPASFAGPTTASEFAVLVRDAGNSRPDDEPYAHELMQRAMLALKPELNVLGPDATPALRPDKTGLRARATTSGFCASGQAISQIVDRADGSQITDIEYVDCATGDVTLDGKVRFSYPGSHIDAIYRVEYAEFSVAGTDYKFMAHGVVTYDNSSNDPKVLANLVVVDQLQLQSVWFDHVRISPVSLPQQPSYQVRGRLHHSEHGYADLSAGEDLPTDTASQFVQVQGDQSSARVGLHILDAADTHYGDGNNSGTIVEVDTDGDGTYDRGNFIINDDLVNPGSVAVVPHLMHANGSGEILQPLTLSMALSRHRGGQLASVNWQLLSAPAGSSAQFQPASGPMSATITPDKAGKYSVRVVLSYPDTQVERDYDVYAYKRVALDDFPVSDDIRMRINPDNDSVVVVTHQIDRTPWIYRTVAASGSTLLSTPGGWRNPDAIRHADISENGRYVALHTPAPSSGTAVGQTRLFDTVEMRVTQTLEFASAPASPGQKPIVTNDGSVFFGHLCRADFAQQQLIDVDTGAVSLDACASDAGVFGVASDNGQFLTSFDTAYDLSNATVVTNVWPAPPSGNCPRDVQRINATTATYIWCDELRRLADGSMVTSLPLPWDETPGPGPVSPVNPKFASAGHYTAASSFRSRQVAIINMQTGATRHIRHSRGAILMAATDSSGQRTAILRRNQSDSTDLLLYF